MSSISKVSRLVNLAAFRSAVRQPSRVCHNTNIRFNSVQRIKQNNYILQNTRSLSTATAAKLKDDTNIGTIPLQKLERNSSPSVDRSLHLLDSQVQKWNRVDSDEVYSILRLVDEAGSLSSQQAVMILRCLGTLMVKETPDKRQSTFQECWRKFKQYGVKYNVSHFNAALRVQLENKASFDNSAFLNEMETAGVVPNRITYQLLIARHCDNGDLTSAKNVLDLMKAASVPINVGVFNSLVAGHMVSNDDQGAKQVIENMKFVHG